MRKSKSLIAVILVLVLTLSCGGVVAESSSSCPAAESETVAQLLQVLDFKFRDKDEGIGTGFAPVYTAPSEDSIRLSNGRASCNVARKIGVLGHVNGWLMVRYNIGKEGEKNPQGRVGYIPPSYSRKYQTGTDKIEFSAIPVQLAAETEITDNPRGNSIPYGTLGEGTDITILGKYTYTGNWWYIETTLDGMLTRGFINRTDAALRIDGKVYTGNSELGYPAAAPDGSGQIGMITVNGTEKDAMIVRRSAGAENAMVARVHGGDEYPCYGTETLKSGRVWYHIWVDGVWGWFSSGLSTFTEGK